MDLMVQDNGILIGHGTGNNPYMPQGTVLGNDHRISVHPGHPLLQLSVKWMGDIGLGQGKLGAVLLDGLDSRPLEPFVLLQAQVTGSPEMEQVPLTYTDMPSGKRVTFRIKMEYPLSRGIGKYIVNRIQKIIGCDLCHS